MKRIVILSLGLLLSSCAKEEVSQYWILQSNVKELGSHGEAFYGTESECKEKVKLLRYTTYSYIPNLVIKCIALKDLP